MRSVAVDPVPVGWMVEMVGLDSAISCYFICLVELVTGGLIMSESVDCPLSLVTSKYANLIIGVVYVVCLYQNNLKLH